MELVIGQYSNLGPIDVWKLCPLFKGETPAGDMTIIQNTIAMHYNYQTSDIVLIFLLKRITTIIVIRYIEMKSFRMTAKSCEMVFSKLAIFIVGIGYGTVLVSSFIALYVIAIMNWTLYYLFKSFTKTLPWANCENDWNTVHCLVRGHGLNKTHGVASESGANFTKILFDSNWTSNFTEGHSITPAEEFWE